MEEAEAKLERETPLGGSRLETLRKLFEGDASSKMKLDLEEVDTGGTLAPLPTGGGRVSGRLPRGHGGPPKDIPTTPIPPTSPRNGWRRRQRCPHGAEK